MIINFVKDISERYIYLTKERWKHIQKHPPMANKMEMIESTLKEPSKIIQSERIFYTRVQ